MSILKCDVLYNRYNSKVCIEDVYNNKIGLTLKYFKLLVISNLTMCLAETLDGM